MTTTITVSGEYTKLRGEPATGLTLADIAITLERRLISTGASSNVWGTQPPTDEVGSLGQYQRDYTVADLNLYTYHAAYAYTGGTPLDQDDDAGIGRVSGAIGIVDGNIAQISEDSVAADNLELQYDTTGITGDTFPATQAQLGALTIAGAAISTPAKLSPNGFVITFGENEVNNEDSTHAADDVYHDIEAQNDAGTERIDVYYEFAIGGDGVPVSVGWEGQLDRGGGAPKNITVQARNWAGASWDQIGSISSGTTDSDETFVLFTSHVGTGANLGLVRIRFVTGSVAFSATTTLMTDQIFTSYAIVSRTVGYANGSIWVDTNASNTNTEAFVDGVADNPVSTWAAALTLSTNLNINNFNIAGGSTITLTGNSDSYELFGDAWTLALGGQSISGAFIHGAIVSGIATGAVQPTFEHCLIGTVTLPGVFTRSCGLSATFTCSAADDYFFFQCFSEIAGVNTPILDFGAAIANTKINLRSYSGGIEVQNMNVAGSDTMSLEGNGQLILNANCTGGTIAIRGHFPVTDDAGGAITLSRESNYVESELVDADWDELLTGATHNINNSSGKILRQVQEGGYQDAAVWIDTGNGNPGADGTITDPVDSITPALVVANTLGFRRIEYITGSSDTLVAAVDGFRIQGFGYSLALGGQSISGTRIKSATITGICVGANPPEFRKCDFGNVTLPSCMIRGSSFGGTLTLSNAGNYFIDKCFSAVAGITAPVFDFGAAVGNTNLNMRHYSGGVDLRNMGAGGTDKMSLEGFGQLILNANCVGGTIAIRGHFTVIDNSGAITLSDNARYDSTELVDDIYDEAKAGHVLAGSFGEEIQSHSTSTEVNAILYSQMVEAYAADGVAPTLAQAIFLIQQSIGDFGVSGTTLTVRSLNGASIATYTLDDAANPTDRTRTT